MTFVTAAMLGVAAFNLAVSCISASFARHSVRMDLLLAALSMFSGVNFATAGQAVPAALAFATMALFVTSHHVAKKLAPPARK